MQTGLIHVYCGDGKGKTTAAAGLALRASGCGKDVIFAQFMKGNDSGETAAMKGIERICILSNSKNYGFYHQMSGRDKEEVKREHNAILDRALQSIKKGECDILILDEITYPYRLNLVDKAVVEKLVREKPSHLELVLTGRDPDKLFLEYADYVTEMKCIRHPYEKGVAARRGIEY